MDPYRRDPKDISLADGHEERRGQIAQNAHERMTNPEELDCNGDVTVYHSMLDDVPWEADHADEYTVYDSSERTAPVCQHCGLAILHSALVVGGMYFCGEFCKERFAVKIWSRFTHR